jgi:hypothetical protein
MRVDIYVEYLAKQRDRQANCPSVLSVCPSVLSVCHSNCLVPTNCDARRQLRMLLTFSCKLICVLADRQTDTPKPIIVFLRSATKVPRHLLKMEADITEGQATAALSTGHVLP